MVCPVWKSATTYSYYDLAFEFFLVSMFPWAALLRLEIIMFWSWFWRDWLEALIPISSGFREDLRDFLWSRENWESAWVVLAPNTEEALLWFLPLPWTPWNSLSGIAGFLSYALRTSTFFCGGWNSWDNLNLPEFTCNFYFRFLEVIWWMVVLAVRPSLEYYPKFPPPILLLE